MSHRAWLERATVLTMGAAASLAGCQPPTEITLELTTDFQCSDLRETAIVVGTPDDVETKAPATIYSECDHATGRIGSLVVVPSGSTDDSVAVRIVSSLGTRSAQDCLDDANSPDCIVARRTLRFVRHTPLSLPITLQSWCKGKPCAPGSTCVDGECVPADANCAEDSCSAGAGGGSGASGWTELSPSGALPTPRNEPLAVWTGSALAVWGGWADHGPLIDGGLYDPVANAWTLVPSPPDTFLGRLGASAAWASGRDELVVWGGVDQNGGPHADGARYAPATRGWQLIAAADLSVPGFVARRYAAVVWAESVQKLIVWGGEDANGTWLADGAAYDPAANSWAAIPAGGLAARSHPPAVWVGHHMVIAGGLCEACNTAAAYDPAAKQWSAVLSLPGPASRAAPLSMATTDGRVVVWGGQGTFGDQTAYDDGWLLDVDSGSGALSVTPIGPAPDAVGFAARFGAAGFAARGKIWIWGGGPLAPGLGGTAFANGASYDFDLGQWTPMPTDGAPPGLRDLTFTWAETVGAGLLFGGWHDDAAPTTSALYAFRP
jgi:hypothetical protein